MITPGQKRPTLLALFVALLTASVAAAAQTSFDLRSPDNRIEVRIRTTHQIRYDVLLKGRALMLDCPLSLDVDHKKLGLEAKLLSAKNRSYDQVIEPPVRQKFARIRENYNEVRLAMEGGFAVTFRAYNEGQSLRRRSQVQLHCRFHRFLSAGRHHVFPQ
jgi:alpha-glucosidase